MTETTISLGSLAWIRAGYQSRSKIEESPSGTHALIQLRDFSDDRQKLNAEKAAWIEPGAINPEQILQKGDVLFLAKGAKNFAFVPSDLPSPSLVASYFFIVRPDQRVLPSYLAWFLNLESTKKHFSRLSGYSAHMPVVRRDVLERTKLPLPDIETQRKIVELDDLIQKQDKLLHDLAKKKSLLGTELCRRLSNQTIKFEP